MIRNKWIYYGFIVILILPIFIHNTEAEIVVPIGVLISDSSETLSIVNLIEYFEREINAYLSTQGHNYVIDYIIRDNERSPVTALENVQYFKGENINLIVELGDESQSQAILSYINNNNMVLISAASSGTSLSIKNDRLFRVAINDHYQAQVLAQMWSSWGTESIVIMHRADLWGDGLKDELSNCLDDVGVAVLGYVRYDHNNPDLSSYVSYANNLVLGSIGSQSISKLGLQIISRNEIITIQQLTVHYPILQSIIWMSTGDGGRNQAILNEVGDLVTQTRHFSSVLSIDSEHPEWEEFFVQYLENNSIIPDWNQALMYDTLALMSNCVVDTGSFNANIIADALIPYSWTYSGITGSMKLDVNGDRVPSILDIWGYYEDPISSESLYRSWGYYDGLRNEVNWDDLSLINYAGVMRPNYLENPFSSALSCSISSQELPIWNSQLVSCLLEPQLARTSMNFIYMKPDGSTITRVAETDESGFSYDSYIVDQAGTWKVHSYWAGDDVHTEAESPTITFYVDKLQSEIECYPKVSSSTLGYVLQVTGNISPVIEGSTVIFAVTYPNGTIIEKIGQTDSNGNVTKSFLLDKAGTWTFRTYWEGDNAYYGSTSVVKEVNVGKYSSEITLEVSSSRVNPGKRISVSGSLNPARSNIPILVEYIYPNGTIEKTYTQTTFFGVFRVDFTPWEPGVYSVVASWDGDYSYNSAKSDTKNITVKKFSSKILIEASKDTINAGSNVTVFGTLDPVITNALIEVIFVRPDSSLEKFEVFTNATGEFSVVHILDETRYYFVSARWGGNDRYNGSSSKSLELEVIDYQHLKIIVKDKDGVVIQDATVASTIQPSGQQTLHGTTNQEGYVLFEKVVTGTYSFLVTLEGYESNTGSLAASPGVVSETTVLLEKEVPQGGGGIPGFPMVATFLAIVLVIIIRYRK